MRRNRIAVPGVLLLSTLLAVSISASAAQTCKKKDAEGKKTARDYSAEGVELGSVGNFLGACEAFLLAFELTKKEKRNDYNIAANLGLVEFELGNMRDAAEHIAYSLDHLPSSLPKEDEVKIERLKRRLADAKKHVWTVRFQVAADDERSVNGAEIRVGGMLVGRWPLDADEFYFDPKPSPQMFTARLPDCGDATWQADVRAGVPSDVPLTLKCRSWVSLGVAAGIAAVGLGVGIGTWVHSAAEDNSANTNWGQLFVLGGKSACFGNANKAACDDLEAADKSARNFRYVSITSFVVGGAAAVVTGAILIPILAGNSSSKGSKGTGERSSTLSISLGLSRGSGGAVVKGSF